MVVLLSLLAAVSLFALRPWGDDAVEPGVSVPLDLGAAVEEAVALPSAPPVALADARPVPVAAPVLVVDNVAVSPPASKPPVAISSARVVAVSRPAPVPVTPPAPAPAKPTPAPVAPAPVALPIAAPAPAPAAMPPPAPLPEAPAPEGPTILLVREGDEYELSFSLAVEAPLLGELPAEELIVQFTSEASDLPGLGLRLSDDGSGAGHALWASGELAGGDRLLAPLTAGEAYEATVYFRASSEGDGFYMVTLDGALIDANFGVDLIEEGSSSAAVELGPGASIAELSG